MKGENNSVHKFTEETKNKIKNNASERMKKLILEGKFTPPITNSWSNSKIKIKFDNCNYKFRSTWECLFWISNKNLLYEKIRIPYVENFKSKIYIVDFADEKNKILYEIKPSKNKQISRNIIKEFAAIEWCKINGYTYKTITENELIQIIDIIEQEVLSLNNSKIIKGLNKLKKLKNENFKN
jgi:hypothetical protein